MNIQSLARRCARAAYLAAGFMGMSFATATTASAEEHPRFVTIDVPGAQGTACYSDCSHIVNNVGQMTGSYVDANNAFHGFLRNPNGKLITFDAPGADLTPNDYNGTFPDAINDAGVITGYLVDVNNNAHGFLRSPDGVITTFDVPTYQATFPINLNLEGSVVGYAVDAAGVFQAFLRTADGKYHTWAGPNGCYAPSSSGCYGAGAFGINLFGYVVGAYEDNSGNFVDIGMLRSPNGYIAPFEAPGAGKGSYEGTGCPGCSIALNTFGFVAGLYIDDNFATHGYVRNPWGGFVTFDPPGEGPYGIGCANDCPIDMNDWGSVTGFFVDVNNVYRGYVRSPEGKITVFDAPAADTTANDYNGTVPISINDAGVIAGYYLDAHGNAHGFIRYP